MSKFALTVLSAALFAATAHAQEDSGAAKVKALFAKTVWCYDPQSTAEFGANGTLTRKVWGNVTKMPWVAFGPRSVKAGDREWKMTADGKELMETGKDGGFMTHYRGASLPQDYPFLVMTLAKPNTVWRLQEAKERTTLAFGADWNLVQGKDGEATDFSVT